MNLKLLIRCRKLNKLENYIAFLNNQDLNKIPPLSIGGTEELRNTNYDNLFSYLDEYDILKKKYSLDDVIKGETDFEKALSLMQWLTDTTYYNGMQLKLLPDNTLSILKFSYKKPFKYAINCRDKAIALADILLACGFKAYPIAIVGDKTFADYGNHLLVQVYLREKKKWVLLDPYFNTYFTDCNNDTLDVFEMRNCFLEGKDVVIHGYNFNGTQECIKVYKEAFIKSCLTNISTWHDNSNANRYTTVFKKRKAFDCRLPEYDLFEEWYR